MICLRYHFVFADKSDLDTKSAPSIQLLQPKPGENKVMAVTRHPSILLYLSRFSSKMN
ncbi:GYF domain-containing protein [Zea mays]|uniref:GYF domain-containing protein n=1 Tax=Zea mays TaxID=4577 RepID=A0A1D6L6G1_MAIZE|nr:GYF domain-containing protein [Zea mays]ONM09894.1 GYF domain-containing protein [Zea mays]ONM09897.1 GYF domain-containing protein [Zea mays]